MAKLLFTLSDTAMGYDEGDWFFDSDSFDSDRISDTPFTLTQEVLEGGRQDGVRVITLTCENGLTISLCPTRGMDILEVFSHDGTRLGWDSPVDEIAHPKTINLEANGGCGWAESFNEMMVRCGYAWAGHPVREGNMFYTLHGRAGNLPASRVEVEISDEDRPTVRIRGLVKEKVFKGVYFECWTELSYELGSQSFAIHDHLTNVGEYPHDYQLVYHSNFGAPLLEEGARFVAPVEHISPFNDYAKPGLSDWQTFVGPTANFDEMMFNIRPYANNAGNTKVALIDKAGERGVAIAFDTRTLPVLSLWKNTDTLKHGYVTGIEPGTGFCYPVTVEREQGRVKSLAAGESVDFNVIYTLLHGADDIAHVEREVEEIQAGRETTVSDQPIAYE
ncbi:aldose 1-epimerase family protein [Zymobacter sp. IVIA_5232.4 C2]|uniref:aldose 1-epimerase family protein n=1 Tax=Zymobacter sp. IVIA_5232.4 C2 TaxID=3394855 RepID=UPI0039C3AC46